MSVVREKIADFNPKEIYEYILDNGKGLSAHILNYGGIIKKLIYNNIDVVLGRDTFEEYLDNDGYFGAVIGRNSNRLEKSEFELNGKVYKLYSNEGHNNLHGGKNGFDKKVWDAEIIDGEEPSLNLSTVSPNGEEGFPGEVKVKVTYTLTADNSLKIHYEGESNADTILNMTNHSYFNLNGHSSGSIDGHTLWIDSDFYTPNTKECLPDGEIKSVNNSPFDFRTESVLKPRLESTDEQIVLFKGFDHNFIINGYGFRKAASLKGDKTAIIMEVYTDLPGMQVYTVNSTNEERLCKDAVKYCAHGAICLETQFFPNNLKYSHFPSAILRKNCKYNKTTEYKFI